MQSNSLTYHRSYAEFPKVYSIPQNTKSYKVVLKLTAQSHLRPLLPKNKKVLKNT